MNDPGNIHNKHLRKSAEQIGVKVYAMATYYPGMIKVYLPNEPIKRLQPGWESQKKTYHTKLDGKTSNETILERSIRRSQKAVYDYAQSNRFSLFATFTIAKNRHNPQQSKVKIHNWLKNQRKRTSKFPYILVPEYHKDGALHFHVLIGAYPGKLKESQNAKTGKLIMSHKKPVYEFPAFKSGFTKVQYVGDTVEDRQRVGGYIRKYITKEMISVFNQKRYWISQGLKKSPQEDNPKWYKKIKADDTYENEYGTLLTYRDLDNKLLPDYVRKLTELNNL